MSKIAEHKALEIYPDIEINWTMMDRTKERMIYADGYDQALQDIQEQAEKSVIEKSNGEVTIEDLVAYNQGFKTGRELALQDFLENACEWLEDTQLENFICRDDGVYFDNEKLIEQFKNYMQDE